MKTKTKKKFITLGVTVVFLAVFSVVALWRGLTVKAYTETTDKVTSPIRIAVIADLHSVFYGDKQETLIKAIYKQNPDILFLVGDIADDYNPIDGTKQLLSVIGTEYPCYYVSGNHEYWSGEVDSIKDMIRSYGVTILEGDTDIIQVGNQKLRLCGVDDPTGIGENTYFTDNDVSESWQGQLDACKAELGDNIYSILLSHRPELTENYKDSGFDLVVAGHAHGGQVRIPLILNGLLAPNQGWFPKYAGGRYELGETTMIVSRGLQKDKIPRIFNPPELVIVNLEPER
ncbi:MAG: phosphoesterase [Firmicutes bacterium HGW-Firmicutes-16]|nr:MAG: phosphoesterase [Firmicutes bacterium HGW-Firmicutes-16]